MTLTMTLNQQRKYLNAMGIQVWERRNMPAEKTVGALPDSIAAAPPSGKMQLKSVSDWDVLRQQVSSCTACELHKTRTQTVFGIGDRNADWLIIGEAPAEEEDRQGEPFVGEAGQLLTAMLQAIGLKREQVFITNVLKCRLPNNRDPRSSEILQCDTFLRSQLALIQPKIILVVGRVAAQTLLKSDIAIGKLRGQVYQYGEREIPLVVTYHPAYLLRMPSEKRKAWNDLKLAVKIYKESSCLSDKTGS